MSATVSRFLAAAAVAVCLFVSWPSIDGSDPASAADLSGAIVNSPGYLSGLGARLVGGGFVASIGTRAVSGAAGGVVGGATEQAVCGRAPSRSALTIGGVSGTVGTTAGETLFPPKGGFVLRSVRGLYRVWQPNTRRAWLSGGASGAAGVGIGYVAGSQSCK